MAALHRSYGELGLRVVAVNMDTYYPLEEWRQYWMGNGGGNVPVAQDTDGGYGKSQVLATGTKVVIDRRGRIVFHEFGRVAYEKLAAVVEPLL